jgi:hypothetical protein
MAESRIPAHSVNTGVGIPAQAAVGISTTAKHANARRSARRIMAAPRNAPTRASMGTGSEETCLLIV